MKQLGGSMWRRALPRCGPSRLRYRALSLADVGSLGSNIVPHIGPRLLGCQSVIPRFSKLILGRVPWLQPGANLAHMRRNHFIASADRIGAMQRPWKAAEHSESPGDRQPPMPALTNVRQERFALALVKGFPASRAYEIAGYEPDRSHAARLATNGRMKTRVTELMGETKASAALTREKLTEMMLQDRALAREKGQAAAAIRASELLGMQFADMYRKRSDVNVTNDVAAMSDDDLRLELARQLKAAGLVELADSLVASVEPDATELADHEPA